MKKNLLIFIFFSFVLNAYPQQPVIKVFAFEQENYPGTVPANTKDENGNSVKKAADRMNYFLFLSFRNTYSITPVEVYIRGQAYQIQSIDSPKTPVEYTVSSVSANPEKKVLVPKTTNKVIEIKIAATKSQQEKKTTNLQKLITANDIVIGYKWNNKKYFATEKKLKRMEPVYHE